MKIKLVLVWLFNLLIFISVPLYVRAEETYKMDLEGYDLSEIQNFINHQQEIEGEKISFEGLMKDLVSGNFHEVMSKVGKSLESHLFYEIKHNWFLVGQVVMLGFMAAVFTNFSNVFSGSQISETGFFAVYMLLFTCLASGFFSSVMAVAEIISQILEFMKVLLPSYFLAAGFAGGGLYSAAAYGFTLFIISLTQWGIANFLIPLIKVYMLLVLVRYIAKEDFLSKLTDLIKQVITWSLKTVLGLILGYHMIQGMVLPYVDSLKIGTIQKLVEVVPGIGQGAGAVAQMVIGSGVLVKNTMGAAGVILLLIMTMVPILKLVVLMVLYQCAAAVMQPVCDKRIVACISETAGAHKLLLGILLAVILLFLITIAIVCISTNAVYYAG